MNQQVAKKIRQETRKQWKKRAIAEQKIEAAFIQNLQRMRIGSRIKFGFKIIFRRY